MAKAKKDDVIVTEVTEETTVTTVTTVTETPAVTDEPKKAKKPVAKAGKRSAKAIEESEALEAKEARKAEVAADDAADKPKHVQKNRTVLERRGKKYRATAGQIEVGKAYGLSEALDLAVKTSPVKFDASVEIHINLGIDPRQADQNLRDTLVLPNGTGKTVRVAVFADEANVTAAKKAGADVAAGDEFLQQLDKGVFDFDILIATPAMMAKLGKYARVLGPKGLMPNPKSGTVTSDVAKAVTQSKAGRVEYRVDSTGIVHLAMGKVSFGAAKLQENAKVILASIRSNKPASIKGTYVKSVHVTTSMGPSVKVAVDEA